MSIQLQLYGEGVSTLRLFLATHLRAKQWDRPDVKKVVHNEIHNILTTCELRQIATLLGELRAVDSSIPCLVSLLRHGRKNIQVRVISDCDEEENTNEEQKMKVEKFKYLAKRREKLQRLDEEMQYGSMVRNFKPQSVTKELAHYHTNVRQHLSIGANMVMARVTAFVAVYFVARNLTDNETTRLIAGLGGAIVMMVIEMVLYIARATKIENFEHQQKQRRCIF
ncbi:unnamed protein product [Peronospora belbahrii]|uniref:Uncharacterized protein n=1 Tax=Peronospora belbahrii TaxID=622444 RepID=A0AAU9L4J3_9STRA|nr:unnamed protein product [Peronospora belbahrii]